MKKSIKIITTIATIGIIAIGSYLLGSTHAETRVEIQTITEIQEVIPEGYININSNEFKDNFVDMRTITYFEINDGLQLYFNDGTGYYLE